MKLFVLFIGLAVTFVSCKKTAEEEIASWEKNKLNVESQKNLYPNVSSLIDSDVKSATAIWNGINQSLPEEEKAKEMSKANSRIKKSVNMVARFERAHEELEESISLLERNVPTDEISDRIETKIEVAEKKLAQGEERFNEKIFEDFNSLNIFVKDYDNAYSEYTLAFNRYVSSYEEKIDKERALNNKKNSSTTSGSSTTGNKTSKATSTTKCKYCKKTLSAGSKKCGGCGASL